MDRLGGGLTGVGAVVVVLSMLLSPVASAGTAPNLHLTGATPSSAYYSMVSGCSTLGKAVSSLNARSGNGKFSVSTQTANCPASLNLSSSESWVYASLGDNIPVKIRSSASGVKISFSVQANGTEAAVVRGSTSHCPVVWNNQTSYNGTTWYNQTYGAAQCELLANIYVVVGAYLYDGTTGTYQFPTTYGQTTWSNESGYSSSFETFSYTYSNPLYWSQNFSYPGSWTNYSLGTGGIVNINAATTLYFNGSFTGTDHYVIGFSASNEVFAQQAYFKGSAQAKLNAATHGNHEDITAVAVY
ncbi:MAG: hypothetical protein L3K08_00820 [Thermoplasmata archaeon]|nr:hypothetical protein [Thermoplasmata archaeon]